MAVASELSLTAACYMSDFKKIGEGGFGEVFKVQHKIYGIVAYKKMAVGFIKENDSSVKDMQREARVQSALRHQNVVLLLAMVFEEKNYGIVLEYAKYGDLKEFLNEFVTSWQFKVKIALDVAIGMCYLHANSIIHGDLKIQNILICDGFKAKVSDFGLARWKEYSRTRSKRPGCGGTVTHISPERWKNINASPEKMHDVYGYGVLLWEISTQQIPFYGASPECIRGCVVHDSRPDVGLIPSEFPPEYKTVMTESWSPLPENRRQFDEIKKTFENLTEIPIIQEEIHNTEFKFHLQEKNRRVRRNTQREEEVSEVTPKAVDTRPVESCISRLEIADEVTRSAQHDHVSTDLNSCIVSSVPPGNVDKSAEPTDDCLISLHSDIGIDEIVMQDGDDSMTFIGHESIVSNVGVLSNQTSCAAITNNDPSMAAAENSALLTRGQAPVRIAANEVRPMSWPEPESSASSISRSQRSEVSVASGAVSHVTVSRTGSCPSQGSCSPERTCFQPPLVAGPESTETTQPIPSHQLHLNSNFTRRAPHFSPEHSRSNADTPNAERFTNTAPAAVISAMCQPTDDHKLNGGVSHSSHLSTSNSSFQQTPCTVSTHRTVQKTSSSQTLGREIHIKAGGEVFVISPAGSSSKNIVVAGVGANFTSKHHARQPSVKASEAKPKKKIIVPDKVVDTHTLHRISGSIGKDWRSLGRELRFEDGELDGLSYQFRHDGAAETAHQMLRDWHERRGKDATLEVLARALVNIKRGDLAEKLSKL